MDREKKGGREPWADADIERDRGGEEERPGKQEENQVRGRLEAKKRQWPAVPLIKCHCLSEVTSHPSPFSPLAPLPGGSH